ncbi:hypothetical protein [Chryseobacterium vaccae]|uniref:hypothetical protein n=1 Tax=Chryseobacterium vaccae TaxID=2604424 RepID=UPI001296C864|nr:hypothetical protein [Chryseobacterium vaccae]
MKLITAIFTFLPIFLFSQQKYFIVTIDKYDTAYPKENERFFWIIDESDKDSSIYPLFFFTVDEEMKTLCKNNSSLGIFNRTENTLPDKQLNYIFNKIYNNKNLVYSVKKEFVNGNRKIRYKLYVSSINTEQLFSCKMDMDDGRKINYQGKVFFIDKDFKINKNITKDDLNKLGGVYSLDLNHIQTNPYETMRFK